MSLMDQFQAQVTTESEPQVVDQPPSPRLVPLVPILIVTNLVTLAIAGGLWFQNRDLGLRLAARDIQPEQSSPQSFAISSPLPQQAPDLAPQISPAEAETLFSLDAIQALLIPDSSWQLLASGSAVLGEEGLDIFRNGVYDSITLPGTTWSRKITVSTSDQVMDVTLSPDLLESEGWQSSYKSASVRFGPSYADGVYGSRGGYVRVKSGFMQLYLYDYAPESPTYQPNPEGGAPLISFPYIRNESIFISDPVPLESLLQ